MKKIICRITLCLAILSVGVVATSCDKDTVQNLINMIIGGQDYTYTGDYSMQVYGLNTETGNLAPVTEVMTWEGTNVTARAKNASIVSQYPTVDLTLPGTEIVEGATMTNVTISNLVLNDTKLEVGDNTTATGSFDLTIDGRTSTLEIYDITIEADITADAIDIKDCVVYFGEEGDYAVRIKFPNGKVVK